MITTEMKNTQVLLFAGTVKVCKSERLMRMMMGGCVFEAHGLFGIHVSQLSTFYASHILNPLSLIITP